MKAPTGRQLALRLGCAPAGQGLAPGAGVLASKSLQDVFIEHVGTGFWDDTGLQDAASRVLDLGSVDLMH